HGKVLKLCAQCHIELYAGHSSSAGAIYHKFYFVYFLFLYLQRIEEGRRTDDGSAVLVIVHHRDVQLLLQLLLYIKTFRRLDVFKVDTAKRRLQRFYNLYKFFRVFFVYLNIKYIKVGKYFKEQALPF